MFASRLGNLLISDFYRSSGRAALRAKRRLLNARAEPSILDAEFFIEFLKHFSSFTPLEKGRDREALGGGYLLALGGYNIVIDPGHHFLDNFFSADHIISDIDAIIVTHFHDDHYADLPALLSLVYAKWKDDSSFKIDIFLDETSQKMFRPIINGSKYIRNKLCLTDYMEKTIPLELLKDNGISITPLPTLHGIFGRNTGVGLLIKINRGSFYRTILITGDTGWNEEIEESYKILCSNGRNLTLIPHISSVYEGEDPGARKKLEPHKNHLCIYGLCKSIEATKPGTVILSEIGEELDESVTHLCKLVRDIYDVDCFIGQMERDDRKSNYRIQRYPLKIGLSQTP